MSYDYDHTSGKVASSSSIYELPLTTEAYGKVWELDEKLIGTRDYMGLAFFWHTEYKHALRDATPQQRKLVHDKWVALKLPLLGVSSAHEAVIRSVIKSGW